MLKGKLVSIDSIKGSERNYIIKDRDGITLGRIEVIEYSKDNKNCTCRIEFYRDEDTLGYLKDAIQCFTSSLFVDMGVQKLNILVQEDLELQPLVDLKFSLQGIVSNNKLKDGKYIDEYLFGIDIDVFENSNVTNILRLNGENITLKVLSPEDAGEVLSFYIRNKEYLKPFEPSRKDSFYTLESQKQFIVEHYNQFLNGGNISFGIYIDNRLIGKIQLSNIVLGVFRNAFIGYSIDEKEQGKGYMKEAVKLALDYAFNDMDLHRIEATALVENHRSKKVLIACGFKEIGISEKYLFINGEWRDHSVFYKVAEG
ncbi:MAG: GNAT family N-acetyltransferase [Clostridiaceae bacterium]|nr:GNAT family N-acetyltransferase [Clostridiaceae bacterium]